MPRNRKHHHGGSHHGTGDIRANHGLRHHKMSDHDEVIHESHHAANKEHGMPGGAHNPGFNYEGEYHGSDKGSAGGAPPASSNEHHC